MVAPDKPTGQLPLLVVYHGGGDSPERALRYTRFDKLAASGEAVVVFPQGVDGNWNEGRVTSDLRQRASSNYDVRTYPWLVNAVGDGHPKVVTLYAR